MSGYGGQFALLGPTARGELTFCQGFSEPEAGSDLASLTTRAVRRDDRWIVDGHKIWTSSAWLADWIYLAVRTNPDEPRHRGISVLVAVDTAGIEVRRFPVLGGGYLYEVFLDGAEISAESLTGDVYRGWDVLMHTLDFERITVEKLGAAGLDPGRARGAAAWDRAARRRQGPASRLCVESSLLRDCSRSGRPTFSTAANPRALRPRWPPRCARVRLTGSAARRALPRVGRLDDPAAPRGGVALRVKEWLALAGEGENTWRGFLESHPEPESWEGR